MKYKTVYCSGNRLRVRCGKYAFTKEQGYALESMLCGEKYVKSADISHINGSILVNFEEGNTEKVKQYIKGIDISKVMPDNKAHADKETKLVFEKKIFNMILQRFFWKFFIPVPIANFFAVYNSLKFLKAGIDCLFKFDMRVELLDAASIGTALLRRDFKTANSIMFLLSLSEVIEEYTMDKARNSLADNLSLNVEKVWKITDNGDISVSLKKIAIGDLIRVRSGSVIPVDGTIESGEACINESSMTGESTPVAKGAGKTVYAGTVIEEGSIAIKVTALDSETRFSKIISMIDESENYKAEIHSRSLRLADNIVPFSFAAALGTFLLTRNATKAISVLMVDYSCAIKLSAPICIAAAMSEAAKNGIAVKGGKFLEIFSQADAIVFDKTGTLTKAEPKVKKIVTMNGFTEEYVLKTSACLEEHFPHSVARAIVNEAEEKGVIHAEEHAEVEYIVAHGIASKIGEKKVIIGSAHFVFEDEKTHITDEERQFIEENSKGYSAIFLAVGGKTAGFILIDDPLRDEAEEVISALREKGFEICMLTGDGEYAAKKVSGKLCIDNFKFGVLPEDKSETVNTLKDAGKKVVMVGDGINDTPALASADVSVSLKESSDIAKEVADIIIMSEDLHKLLLMREISEGMMKKIDQNYKFIIGFNTALLILGVTGIIQPAVSAYLHNFSTMAIGSLSMRNCVVR